MLETNQKKQQQLALAMQQFYQTPLVKVSLELMLSIGFTLFLVIAAIQPTLVTMTKLTKEINEKKIINQKLPKKIAALNTAQVEYLSTKKKLLLLDEAIPKKIQIIHYLKIIEFEATKHTLVIVGLSVNQLPNEHAPKTQGKKQTMVLTVTVDGSYPDIKQFIQALEQSRFTFLINSVSFSVKKIHAKQHLLANINLSIPYFKTD